MMIRTGGFILSSNMLVVLSIDRYGLDSRFVLLTETGLVQYLSIGTSVGVAGGAV